MNLTTAIDVSSFIWCEDDYSANKHQYFKLLDVMPAVYEQIKVHNLSVLFREELYDLIMQEFPYNMVRSISCDYQQLTFSFLINAKWFSYIENSDNSVTSVPVIVKTHFNSNIQKEALSQICHLYFSDETLTYNFITYSYFFNSSNSLLLKRQHTNKEIETLCYNTEEEVEQFFDRYKIKFEHNKKHRSYCYYDYEREEEVSPFSSYYNQGEEEAQKLLNDAFLYKEHFYNFDLQNGVYVRFIKTMGLTYHGHDVSDEGDNVPNKVKKKFNKNGRTFRP